MARHEKLQDKLEQINDEVAECKIDLLNRKNLDMNFKDTHMDMSMDMWIVHNRTNFKHELEKAAYQPAAYEVKKPKCLISYYGVTNETCWYETEGERSEDAYVDALGHHLVEAHWKYFTIDVKDQAECDKASHLHYEFLINRCSPKHYLPVMAVFRPSNKV